MGKLCFYHDWLWQQKYIANQLQWVVSFYLPAKDKRFYIHRLTWPPTQLRLGDYMPFR
jgi:hypothetical protein